MQEYENDNFMIIPFIIFFHNLNLFLHTVCNGALMLTHVAGHLFGVEKQHNYYLYTLVLRLFARAISAHVSGPQRWMRRVSPKFILSINNFHIIIPWL
jgi:hypothetical protein